MPQNFILNIFSDIFVLLITFSFDFSYFFQIFLLSAFMPQVCSFLLCNLIRAVQSDKNSGIKSNNSCFSAPQGLKHVLEKRRPPSA